VAAFTSAKVEAADFPFSTFRPGVGMMAFEDVQVQLVDLPPISPEYTESWVFNIVRNADLVLLTIDLSVPDPEEQVLEIAALLEDRHLLLEGSREVTNSDLSVAVKPTLVLATKSDTGAADSALASLKEAYGDDYPIFPLSATGGGNLEAFPRRVFDALGILRVYTKIPGKKPDMDQPYTLPVGSTVSDVAEAVHRDFADTFRYARIWGSERFEGQQVKRDHVVEDGDVLEIHA
jgi:ribosome-interacting GTPase 1